MRHRISYGLFFLMVQRLHHHFLQKVKNLKKVEKRVTSFSPFSSLAFYHPSLKYGVEKSVMVFSALVVMESV
ncbi:hypothetical protein DD595_25665 [Enterobacter cloacae complex sp. 4DZ3-17B2]|nr:hypothetical protein DD595_25665 [Enterobacter cloacae complex sp. 4DZ3-17B2]